VSKIASRISPLQISVRKIQTAHTVALIAMVVANARLMPDDDDDDDANADLGFIFASARQRVGAPRKKMAHARRSTPRTMSHSTSGTTLRCQLARFRLRLLDDASQCA